MTYIDAYKYDYVPDGELPELKRGYIVAKKDGGARYSKSSRLRVNQDMKRWTVGDSPNKPQAGC